MKAKVIFFDRRRGEGLIKPIEHGGTYQIYACNIPGKKTWYAETACMYYEEGVVIDVEVAADGYGFICRTPGIFDKEKWDSLDHDRLAFRCDESGKALNGLFVTSKKGK